MYIVNVSPANTRVNDQFSSGLIDCTPPHQKITSRIVSGGANDTRFQADFYKHIALDIVVETVFNYPYPYVSEKTLRPISCKRMFVIVGAPNTLGLLKRKGFETWHDLLDESYDSIIDNESRFLTVMNAIRDFCNLPFDKVQQYLRSNQDRLEHNYNTLIDLKAKELASLSEQIGV
jgi:hypothetical protein